MKFFLALALVALSAPAHAETLIECRNQRTGAEIAVNRDSAVVSYAMNSTLFNNLVSQGAEALRATGIAEWLNDGGIYYSGGAYFSAAISGEYELGLYTHGFGYVLKALARDAHDGVARPTSFYFNPGECR